MAAYRVTFIDAAVGSVNFSFLFCSISMISTSRLTMRAVILADALNGHDDHSLTATLQGAWREQFVLISSIFPAVLLDGALRLWEWEKLEVLHHRWGGGSNAHYPTPFAQFHRFTAVQYQQYQLAWSDGWGAGAWMGQLLVRVRRLTAKSSNSMSFWLQDDVSRSIRWQVCFRWWLLKKEHGPMC